VFAVSRLFAGYYFLGVLKYGRMVSQNRANGKRCIKKMNALYRNPAVLQGGLQREQQIALHIDYIFPV